MAGKAPVLRLKVGDAAPGFAAPSSGGREVTLEGFRGQRVVLYFYPKDDTPGCTKEACGFRDAHDRIVKEGAVVLGVSPDSPQRHDKFVAKFSLPFVLVSDADHRIADAYGVWGEKKFMGRTYLGVHRVTFLIGRDGRVARIWPEVKPETHAAQILEALKEA